MRGPQEHPVRGAVTGSGAGGRRVTTAVAVVVLVLASAAAAHASVADQGQPVWIDLVSEDAAAAATFYGELFGWQVEGTDGGTWSVRHRGHRIASIVQITNAMPNVSESQWLVGVAVDDLPAAVREARGGGGTVLREITTVPGSGAYAVIRDPQGAPLILGTPTAELGGPREAGFFVWAELWTDDLPAAQEFYRNVLGYRARQVERPGRPYTVLETGDTPRAGMTATPDDEVKPAWAAYVGVTDLAATLERTAALGGRVMFESRPDAAGPRVALIADPTGAVLFVAELPQGREDSR